tara:strand:- start:6218 stop:6814 length:597 start_codon:yes stop_codon:yes gene_type:complete
MALTPTTKIEAVNVCLTNIGEAPVASLAGLQVDAQVASSIIDEVSREVQSNGWHWNTEIHTISPDISNQILLPANTLRVDTAGKNKSIDVVQRGMKLYNRKDNTYTFSQTLDLHLTMILDFDEIPEAARRYITMRSSRVFQERTLGSESLSKFNRSDEQQAWALLQHEEAETGDHNMITDSYSTYTTVARIAPVRRTY